jgi:DNA-binding PadR family transcriptional regulator
LIEVGLLKLIADMECVEKGELNELVKAFPDRYGLRGVDELTLEKTLRALQASGLVDVERGCYRLTQKGVSMVRSSVESTLKPLKDSRRT